MKQHESTQESTSNKNRDNASYILGKQLVANEETKKEGYAAHHIIPFADARTPEAEALRDEFFKHFNLEKESQLSPELQALNQSFNGVWVNHNLPYQLQKGELYHPILHTKEYYKTLYQRLAGALDKEDFLDRLEEVKEDILENRFWETNQAESLKLEQFREEALAEYELSQDLSDLLPEEEMEMLYAQMDPKEEKEQMEQLSMEYSEILDGYEEVKETSQTDQTFWRMVTPVFEEFQQNPDVLDLIDKIKQYGTIGYESTPSMEIQSTKNKKQSKKRLKQTLKNQQRQDSNVITRHLPTQLKDKERE